MVQENNAKLHYKDTGPFPASSSKRGGLGQAVALWSQTTCEARIARAAQSLDTVRGSRLETTQESQAGLDRPLLPISMHDSVGRSPSPLAWVRSGAYLVDLRPCAAARLDSKGTVSSTNSTV